MAARLIPVPPARILRIGFDWTKDRLRMRLILTLLMALVVTLASLGAGPAMAQGGAAAGAAHPAMTEAGAGHPCCPDAPAAMALHPCTICLPVLLQAQARGPLAAVRARILPRPAGTDVLSRVGEVPYPPPRAG